MDDRTSLTITVPDVDGWDQSIERFVTVKGGDIILKHSLISLQKWEAKWHKPYISEKEKTPEEAIDYIRCMTTNKIKDPMIYYYIPSGEMEKIAKYIEDPMSATTFNGQQMNARASFGSSVTAEIIYYWMIALGIPESYKTWHLNQLLTLIRVCEIKQDKPKKMSRSDILRQNRALNAARKARSHTHG